MAYTPTTWVNGATPFINAANLQHIEQGIVDAHALIPSAGKGGFGGVLVASNDAPAIVKAAADYVCDGTSDQVQINAALVDAAVINGQGGPVGGTWRTKVALSGGRFFCDGSILLQNATTLQGQGKGTVLYPVALTAVSGSGVNPALVKLADAAAHLTEVRDLHIDLNAAAGGTGHGINIDMTAGGNTSGLPDMSPDADHLVFNVSMNNGTNGTRHGIWFLQDQNSHNRGSMIANCQIRRCSGNGIRLENSSDMLIQQCHLGGCNQASYYLAGGNTMVTGCKSYFSDLLGYSLVSGRIILSGCSSQDDFASYAVTGGNCTLSGCIADTFSDSGFSVSSNGTILMGCYAFIRGGGRYATGTRGVYFPSAVLGCLLQVLVDPTSVSTPFSGTFTGNRGQVVNADTGAQFAFA